MIPTEPVGCMVQIHAPELDLWNSLRGVALLAARISKHRRTATQGTATTGPRRGQPRRGFPLPLSGLTPCPPPPPNSPGHRERPGPDDPGTRSAGRRHSAQAREPRKAGTPDRQNAKLNRRPLIMVQAWLRRAHPQFPAWRHVIPGQAPTWGVGTGKRDGPIDVETGSACRLHRCQRYFGPETTMAGNLIACGF